MASLPIPDELLRDIFLRLPTPADLARASAACVSFRRVAADRSFLRRYRKLHAPPLLGFLERHGVFHPATAPHTSASAARAVALAADFSFSFLPARASEWVVQEVRDGRVVLFRSCHHHGTTVFPLEFVVCDPLHRRYLLLPRIAVAGDLPVSSVCSAALFLVPPRGDDEAAAAQETSFRVVWMALCVTRELLVFVYSSNTGQWRAIPSQHLFAGLTPLGIFYPRQYVYGCFYSVIACAEAFKVLVLNAQTLELSIAEAPLEAKNSRGFAMVEAGEGRPGMFVLGGDTPDLSYFIRQNDGGSSSQWQKVKTISPGSETSLICNMGKYLLLHRSQSSLLEAGCFALDIETFKLEKVCALGSKFRKLYAYSNFPPSLLPSPTISSGIQDDVKPMLQQDAEVLTAEAQSHHDHTTDVNAGGQAGVSRIRDGAD